MSRDPLELQRFVGVHGAECPCWWGTSGEDTRNSEETLAGNRLRIEVA